MRAQKPSAEIDDVVHNDHRLLRISVDGCVVGARRTKIEERGQIAVEEGL